MLRSMFAGVSGLRSHQAFMDVVGNNIANVNTTGYKSQHAIFSDWLSQALRGAGTAVEGVSGGTNPAQIGLGVRLQAINTNMTQGASQLTGRSTDFAIQGDGFFVVDQAGARAYTRAGAFSIDAAGQLVTPEGGLVQGWQATPQGAVNTNATVSAIRIPVGQTLAPVITTDINIGGNLPADTELGETIATSINTYNSLGTAIPLRVEFTKASPTTDSTPDWTVNVYSGTTLVSGPTTVSFNTDGELATTTIPLTEAELDTIPGAAGTWDAAGITLNLGDPTDPDRLTGASGPNSAAALSQNGSAIGTLVSFSVSQEGLISGVFSNGRNQPLAQIALAAFANPSGLERAGGSMWRATVNSGEPLVGVSGTGGRGTLSGGTLEMSNVDLAAEFTNLITAQRGFQANSRIITASDEILQDLVNMKR